MQTETNRIEYKRELTNDNEYGYCSLIKAAKQVLEKIDLENKTLARITSRERAEKRLWDPIALREALINSIVHNDYTNEVPPKFELFNDRIEITSTGGLPDGLSRDEFFLGYSVPRNKEIMRIFKDLDLVEHLGSGVPRILENYGKECFQFSENFLRMTFPATEVIGEQDTEQVSEQVQNLVLSMKGTFEYSAAELLDNVKLKHRPTFLYNYLQSALRTNLVKMTIPAKPNNRLQKYRLTTRGTTLRKALKKKT